MSHDLSTNERSSFGNVGFQNHANSRPKFQPIRVKALLHFCESDDEESEDKAVDSEEESDSDEPRPLPQNDSVEETSDVSLECVKRSGNPSDLPNDKTEGNKCHDLPYVGSKARAQEYNYIDINKECKTGSITLEAVPNVAYCEQNHSETHVGRTEEKKEDGIRGTRSVGLHQTENVSKCPEVRRTSSSIFQESEFNSRINGRRTSELSGNFQGQENVHAQDRGYRETEGKNYQLVENENGTRQSTEDRTHRNDPHGKDQNSCRSKNVYNPQNIVKHEVLESVQSSEEQGHAESASCGGKTQSSDAGGHPNSVEYLVTDTPHKHAQNSVRPTPCFSRRNISNTPQNKLQMDLSKSHANTPATIFSHWSQNTIKQTPLQSKTLSAKDRLQTPQSSIYFTPNVGKETPRYVNAEGKSVRRPLADATSFKHTDVSAYPMESKSRLLQGSQLSKVDEIVSKPQNDSTSAANNSNSRNGSAKRALEISEKSSNPESNANEQLKENRHPNVSETENKDKLFQSKISESRQSVNSNANPDVRNPAQYKDSKSSKPSTEAQTRFASGQASGESQRQELRQIVEKMSNVQFSVPSNVSKSKHKTIFVKGKEYLILGTLGQGMSGEVLRVQNISTSELCAIKCVNLSRMDKDSAQGCLEEISMLHKLQAPCVVRMFDYEVKYPMVYVVMEMGDTDLSRLLKSMSQEKHLPLTMILYYWTEMLTAVKHIHDNGVIHSDLKPANFLLVRGRLKLIDFGIASSMNADMTSVVKNCPIGTLNYISPEALMDIGGNSDSPTHNVKYKITFKSDVWSLGCILYGLVYGQTPFHHIRPQWAKVNAITNPKPNISFPLTLSSSEDGQKSVSAPPILIDVMRKCLQHDPKARPTVAQLLQIQYVPTKQERPTAAIPDIPANILVKIKHTLNEDEWRQLIQVLENRRYT